MLHDLNSYIVARLLLAGVLGGLVGLERELRHKPAGLRTNMLICFGAALFTIISYEMAGSVGGDHTRIAAQIIPGIGFIGAGVVIRGRGGVVGITSAATIFVMASVGMAVGAGMLMTAIFSTLILLVALVFLSAAEERFGLHMRLVTFRLTTEDPTVLPRAHQIVEQSGIRAQRWHNHRSDEGIVVEFDADVTYPQERDLMEKLATLKVRCDVRPV
ncbi:MAG TPA: MgtC/SapB family protein [Candidatus Binatus sp.]|jgi:putative Mg2+ transporter-C (MgtC) family protein|nr:MgtC/SapB family protein [Candidatus Binatus sp.]